MTRKARVINLINKEKSELDAIVRKTISEHMMVIHAKIVLLSNKRSKNKDSST